MVERESKDFRDVLSLKLKVEGGHADQGRFQAGDLADVIRSFSNISRRSAVLAKGGGNPSVADNRDIPIFVDAIVPGSFIVNFTLAAAEAVAATLVADAIVASMKNAYDYAKQGLENALRERLEVQNPGKSKKWIDEHQEAAVEAAEGLSQSFINIADLVGERATKISIIRTNGSDGSVEETIIEIGETDKRQLKHEESDQDSQLFEARVRRFNDVNGRGAVEIGGDVYRFWPSTRSSKAAEILSQNLADNNRQDVHTRKLIQIEATPVRSSNGNIKRLILHDVW